MLNWKMIASFESEELVRNASQATSPDQNSTSQFVKLTMSMSAIYHTSQFIVWHPYNKAFKESNQHEAATDFV
jgi:hypothetical protein